MDVTQQVLIKSQSLFQHSRALKQRPDMSCLWKLLGDACTTSRTVSPNRAKVMVPGALCGMDPPDQGHTLDQRQLLTLGER